jgi:hypothetical protein
MSIDPMRFRVADNQAQRTLGGNIMEVYPDGPYVLFGDYARLKAFSDEAQAHIAKEERKSRERLEMEQAENARLKAEVQRFKFTLEEERQIAREDWAGLRHENARLKAEVERLTKAGDAMAADLIGEFGSYNSVDEWNAAKEGKQS